MARYSPWSPLDPSVPERRSGWCHRWRRRLMPAGSLALVLALLAGHAVPGSAQPTAPAGRYIVVLRDSVGGPAGDSGDTAGLDRTIETLSQLHGVGTGHVYRHALRGFAATVPAGRLAALARDPRVAFVEPDLEMTIAAELRTGVDRVDADLHPLFVPGRSVDADIAILDTGIDPAHPDLNVVGGVSFVPGISSYADDHGHGTHVAGIAAGRYDGKGVAGVAPGARLWAVKVLNSSGSGSMSDIIKGIDWVTQRAATIEVANMSLGTVGRADSLRAAVQRAVGAGVVVVAAAGNSGKDVYGADGVFGTSDDFIPAAYPEVAAVSAMADTDGRPGGAGPGTSAGPDDTIASFSNFGRNVAAGNPVKSPGGPIDVAAPGVGIYSTWMRGGYTAASGTSMAAPHAAGVYALYMAHNNVKPSSAAGVYAVRQAIIDLGQPQSQWRADGNTRDPDGSREPLAYAGRATAPQPPSQPPSQPPPASAPGVSISPDAQNGWAWTGTTATYTYTVTNTGGAAGTFTVSTSSAGWPSAASPTSLALAAGASGQITVTHSVPAQAVPGAAATGKVTTAGSGVSAAADFTTTARGFAVTLTPATQSGSAAPGTAATYTYTIKNTGTESDTYTLTAAASTAGWTASVNPASVSLAPGQTAGLTVTHAVPSSTVAAAADPRTADAGAADSGTLRVSSPVSGALAAAGFTTTVIQAAPPPAAGLNVKIAVTGSPRPGRIVEIVVTVTDGAGRPVPAAVVALSMRTATRLYSGSRTTGSAGTVRVWIWTYSDDFFPWTIRADASKNGTAGSSTIVYPSP